MNTTGHNTSCWSLITFAICLLVIGLLTPITWAVRPHPRKPFSPPLSVPRPTHEPTLPPPHHHHNHDREQPLVKEYYQGPPKIIWRCELNEINRQPCELKNGVNFIPFEGSREGLVVDLNKAQQVFEGRLPQRQPKLLYKASRLWTRNYFPARYRNACLYFSYSMSGSHYKQLYILQRNRGDKCIYSAEDTGHTYIDQSSKWINAEIPLNLEHGDPRFVFDFEYDLPSASDSRIMGMVNIRNISIAYGNCHKNDGNECDLPHQISNL